MATRSLPTMFYVVSKRLAQQMRGERVNSPKGSVFGVFATHARAEAFQADNKLTLATEIVQQ